MKDAALVCAASAARAQTALSASRTLSLGQEEVSAARIPRWRGFNLQGRFALPERPYSGRAFDEFDFATMKECDRGEVWDRERLKREYIEKYRPLPERKVQIHVGEWGGFNKTPHAVMLAWMSDCLSLWKEAGWGFALWNLRGSFGVLDSQRADVQYEDYQGHKLDGRMLELLRNN